MNKKFDNFCVELDQLTSAKEATTGINKINEYIENNFVSMKEENKLKEYIDIFNSFLDDENQKKKEDSYKKLSKSQILEKFIKDKKIEESLYNYYFDNILKSFDDEDRSCFEYILKSKKYLNFNKLYAIFALKLAGITESITIYNYFLKKYDVIELDKWGPFGNNIYYKAVLDKLDKLFFKTPSLHNSAFPILFNIYITYLGAPTKYASNELAENLYKMVNETIEGKKPSNKEFEEFVNSISQIKELAD